MAEEEKGRIRSKPPLVVIILIFLCYAYFTYAWPGYWNTNEYSRVFLTRALIDNQTFQIDDIIAYHNTQDKSYHRGHFYTNKAPGSSILAAPVYLGIRLVEINFRLKLSEEIVLYWIKVFCVSAISAGFLIILFKFWGYITLIFPIREAFLIIYALGTIVWPYSSLFYGHLVASLALFMGFLILFDARDLNRGTVEIIEAGFFCGVAFLIEYPTVLISFCLFLYACVVFKNKKAVLFLAAGAAAIYLIAHYYDDIVMFMYSRLGRFVPPPLPPAPGVAAPVRPPPRFLIPLFYIFGIAYLLILTWRGRVLFLFLLGLAVPVGVTFLYHDKCFGGALNFPYFYETFPQFAQAHAQGIAGVTVPRFDLMLRLLVSPFRGLLYYCPVLVLALPGMAKMLRDKGWRKEGGLFLSVSLAYFLFNSAFSDWEGGWSMGPRHLVPLVPFWMTAVVYLVGKSGNRARRWLAVAIAPLSVVSIAFMLIGVSVFPYFPKEFPNPLYELSLRFLLEGKFAPTVAGALGLGGGDELLPLFLVTGGLLLLTLFDLGWMFSRRLVRRLLFCLATLALGALLLLGWERWSRGRIERSPAREKVLRTELEGRVAFYLEQAGKKKK